MTNYIFAYHGGGNPSSPEEGQKVMAAWQAWYEQMGEALVDGGNPIGASRTVSSSGIADDGGSNPLSGYTIVKAEGFDEACEMAKGCPILDMEGTVEVAEIIEM